MKTVIAIVVLFVLGFIGIGYVSNYGMGVIDSGMHNGRGATYSRAASGGSSGGSWFSSSNSDPDPGDVTTNPFTE